MSVTEGSVPALAWATLHHLPGSVPTVEMVTVKASDALNVATQLTVLGVSWTQLPPLAPTDTNVRFGGSASSMVTVAGTKPMLRTVIVNATVWPGRDVGP